MRLDLLDAEAVRVAYRALSSASGEPLMHVQKMATKGIGCVVRVQDDPSFGSLISFGLAGVISDLLGDRAYRVLPLTEDEAAELIDAPPKAAPLLSGYRNAAPVSKAALVDFVQRISRSRTICRGTGDGVRTGSRIGDRRRSDRCAREDRPPNRTRWTSAHAGCAEPALAPSPGGGGR